MILAIRISGQVEIPEKVSETLRRLRIHRKYSAVLVQPTTQNIKLLKHLRDYIAFGDITPETLKLLIEKRAVPIDKSKKVNAESVIAELEKKPLSKTSIKPFFRLHPPIGGLNTKDHFPVKRGVLGDNKEKINDLVRRML